MIKNNTPRKLILQLLLASVIGMCSADRSRAQSFGVHFLGNTSDDVTGAAGVVPITNWNNIANSTFTLGSSTPILASDGSTTATLTLSGGGVHNAWDSGIAGDGANLSLMDGFMDTGDYGGETGTATISGLTNAYYDVYVYSLTDTTRPNNGGDWLPNYTVNGTTYYTPVLGASTASTFDTTGASVGGTGFSGFVKGTPQLVNNNGPVLASSFGNYIELVLVAPVDGAITITAEKDTETYRSPFNGFELVPATGSAPVANPPLAYPATADSAVEAGVHVTLTASAGGTAPISYQWQTDGGSGNTPTNIPGATGTNLVIDTTGFAPGTNVYDFVASNTLGTNTSPVGYVVVVPTFSALPAISVQFAGDGASDTLGLVQAAGYAPEEFWNIDAKPTGITDSNLVDYTGAPTPTAVNVVYANGNYHSSDDTSTPDGVLLSGGFWSGSGYTVNVTGVPYSSYNVFVYMLNDNNPNRRYEFNIGSQTNWGSVFNGNGYSVPPYTLDVQSTELAEGSQMQADLVEFTGITGSSFTINGQTPDGNVAMMGLEIYEAFSGPPVASPISLSTSATIYSGLPLGLSEHPISGTLPYSYQWLTDGGTGGSLLPIANATNSTLAVNTTSLVPGNYNYEVIVENSEGSSTSAVQSVTISTSVPVLVTDITPTPVNEAYAGQTVTYSPAFVGTLPITYQWTVNTGTGATNIPASSNPTAVTSTLILSNVNAGNSGTYTLTASNSVGGPVSTSSSTLTVLTNLPPPASSYAYGAAVLADGPLAYWPLDETNDPSTGVTPAYDASGNGYYGVYGEGTENGFNGIVGPEAPQIPGFPTNNWALGTTLATPGSFVSASAGSLSASNLTYVAWINPSSPVENWAGILMDRGAKGTGFGFGGTTDGTGMSELAYTWNGNSEATWGFNSLLFPTANQWSFVAMVIQPAQTTLYLIGADGVVQSTNNAVTNDTEEFGVAWHIGNDYSSGLNDGSRVFPGSISSVSVYASALSSNQIVTLADVGLGITPPPPAVTLNIAHSLGVPGSLTLTWSQGTLLQSTNVLGPWVPNSAATSPYTVTPSGPEMFYRVKQ